MTVQQALLGSLLELALATLFFLLGRAAVYTPRKVVAFSLRRERGRYKRRLLAATKQEGYFPTLKVTGFAFLGVSAGMIVLVIYNLTHIEGATFPW